MTPPQPPLTQWPCSLAYNPLSIVNASSPYLPTPSFRSCQWLYLCYATVYNKFLNATFSVCFVLVIFLFFATRPWWSCRILKVHNDSWARPSSSIPPMPPYWVDSGSLIRHGRIGTWWNAVAMTTCFPTGRKVTLKLCAGQEGSNFQELFHLFGWCSWALVWENLSDELAVRTICRVLWEFCDLVFWKVIEI